MLLRPKSFRASPVMEGAEQRERRRARDMSWDAKKSGRGKRFYYYRSEKRGPKWAKKYVGAGVVGAMAARRDAEARSRRQEHHRDWDRNWANIEACGQPLDEFCRLLKLMVKSVLVACGYYLHARSEWRRRGNRNV